MAFVHWDEATTMKEGDWAAIARRCRGESPPPELEFVVTHLPNPRETYGSYGSLRVGQVSLRHIASDRTLLTLCFYVRESEMLERIPYLQSVMSLRLLRTCEALMLGYRATYRGLPCAN